MSPSTSTNDTGVRSGGSELLRPLKAGAFWSAVALPFAVLALLSSGLESNTDYLYLSALILANVVALVVGHDYRT
jgi:hypothetical protein